MQAQTLPNQLKVLLKRLSPTNEKFDEIHEEIRNFESGDFGELYVKSALETHFEKNITILTKLNIGQHEADLIALTDYACYLFEVKNMKGHIQITNSPRQMVRTLPNGQKQIFTSPISQLERLHFTLKEIFAKAGIDILIYPAVVFAFNNAEIQSESQQYPILVGKEVINFVQTYHVSGKTNGARANNIARLLQKGTKNITYRSLCDKYRIPIDQVLTGVICPNCAHLPMSRIQYLWLCEKCGHKSRSAHLNALRDYYILISNKITNQECVQFLHLRNRFESYRILKSVSEKWEGTTNNRIYTIKYLN